MNPFRLLGRLFWSLRGLLLWVGLAVAIVVVGIVVYWPTIAAYRRSSDLRDQEKTRVDELDGQVRDWERERDRLNKDGTFEREKVVRERYHWSRSDERMLILESPDRAAEAPAAPTTATAPTPIAPSPSGR